MKLIQNEPVSIRNTREIDENSKKCQFNWILEPIGCFHLPLLILAKNTDSQPLDIKCLCSTLAESGKMLGFPQKNVKKDLNLFIRVDFAWTNYYRVAV